MSFILSTADGVAVPFKRYLAPPEQAVHLPGSTAFAATAAFGRLVMEELKSLHYTIRLNTYHILEKMCVRICRDEPGLHTTSVLQSQCMQTIPGAGRFQLGTGSFASLFGSGANQQIECFRGGQFVTLDMTWSEDWLREFVPRMELPGPSRLLPGVPIVVGAPYRRITPAIGELINNLLYCRYDTAIAADAIDALVKDCLLSMTGEIANSEWLCGTISLDDLDRISAARELIAKDLYTHHHTATIARKVGMNECTLKTLFRQVTGMGTFEYLMYLRCKAVIPDIVETDIPLKALVPKAGYRDLANFVTGFKRHMGFYPGELRRKTAFTAQHHGSSRH